LIALANACEIGGAAAAPMRARLLDNLRLARERWILPPQTVRMKATAVAPPRHWGPTERTADDRNAVATLSRLAEKGAKTAPEHPAGGGDEESADLLFGSKRSARQRTIMARDRLQIAEAATCSIADYRALGAAARQIGAGDGFRVPIDPARKLCRSATPKRQQSRSKLL